LEPLLIFATVEASDFKFGTQHEFEFILSEKTFGTKIGGSEIGEYPQNMGPHFHSSIHSFIAICRAHYVEKVELVFEDNNVKVDTQIGFGSSLSKQLLRNKLAMFYAEPSKFRDHNDGDAGAAMRYDSVYLTYSQTLIRTQHSLLCEIKQKFKRKTN